MTNFDPLSDILSGQTRAKMLFTLSFKEKSDRLKAVAQAAGRGLSSVIREELISQNTNVSPQVDAQLAKLKAGKLAAVVTGQQLGFGGGPLLTLYKILTAVKLAANLEAESGTPTVPIFWLQSEDQDYAEIQDAWFLSADGQPVKISLTFPAEKLGGPVGELVITQQQVSELEQQIAQLPSAPAISELILGSYQAGTKLGLAYQRLMQKLLGSFGLVVFDAHRPSIKALVQGLIRKSFVDSEAIAALMQKRSKELLAANYPEQVRLRANSPLFFHTRDGKRERLTTKTPGQSWAGNGYQVQLKDLEGELAEHPDRFTSSALIRPIFQDSILPTAAYVAGPTEFSYWTQLTALYPYFGLTQPLVVPRARVVIVEQKTERLLAKLGLSVEDAKLSSEEILRRRLGVGNNAPASLFDPAEKVVRESIQAMAPTLLAAEKTLEKPIQQTIESSLANLSRLRGKYEQALIRRESATLGQIERLQAALFPNGESQDRVICLSRFPIDYGEAFFSQLFSLIDPWQGREIVELRIQAQQQSNL